VVPASPLRPSRGVLTLLRLVREGINTLLPFAQIGGVVVAIRLLRRRSTSQATAVGATVVDLNIEMLTQIVFTLLGVALLVRGLGALPLALPLLGGLAMLCAMVAALTAAQWLGLAHLSTRAAARLGFTEGTAALRDTIRAIYADRAGLAWGATGHLLAWALGAFEVCLALHFLGHDIGPGQGWVIESLGQTVRAASFIVPAALGVQEGGYVVICGLFGIGPDLALALSLMKRLRELALGAPSLALWAWLERRGA
jgi:putative membrane protein